MYNVTEKIEALVQTNGEWWRFAKNERISKFSDGSPFLMICSYQEICHLFFISNKKRKTCSDTGYLRTSGYSRSSSVLLWNRDSDIATTAALDKNHCFRMSASARSPRVIVTVIVKKQIVSFVQKVTFFFYFYFILLPDQLSWFTTFS